MGALGGARELRLTQFPFRVGRERRSYLTDDRRPVDVPQRRTGEAPPLNDVYLREEAPSGLHISGAHFSIECVDQRFFLFDRGSACGTMVAGDLIGGKRKAGASSCGGDEVMWYRPVGYIFLFRVRHGAVTPRARSQRFHAARSLKASTLPGS